MVGFGVDRLGLLVQVLYEKGEGHSRIEDRGSRNHDQGSRNYDSFFEV